jgi:hypothetical protein
MASYKDPTNLKFNPYVQQRPVEAMLKVGLYKQERYDQGVQKIQESIDNIAGLDLIRPQDKDYLQSKLNQLGSQLSMVAGGDFSNFQLVNSVNGMTNQIVKDPNVINSVSNTARYKKDLESINKLKQENKWAPSNQYAFNKEVNSWYNSKELDSSYSANVSPYVDTTKEATEIIKNLAKEYTENPVAFDYDDKGRMIARDVITNQKIEGVTPERIQTALKTGLTPQAWRQLSIDGDYKYSNISSEQFIETVSSKYNTTFDYYNKERESLKTLANSAQSIQEKQRLESQIKEMDRLINNTKDEYDSVSAGFSEGVTDAAKSQIYTMDWLDNMSKTYAYQSSSQKIEESPYFSINMKKEQLKLDQLKFEETKTNNSFNNQIALRKLELAEQTPKGFSAIGLKVDKEKTDVDVVAEVDVKIQKGNEEVNDVIEAFKNKYNLTDSAYKVFAAQYSKNPNFLKGRQLQDYIKIKNLEDGVSRLESVKLRAEKESNELYPDRIVEAIPESKKKIKFTDSKGVNYDYDYAMVSKLFDKFQKDYIGTERNKFSSRPSLKYQDDKADKELNYGQLQLYKMWKSKSGSVYNEISSIKNKILKYDNDLQKDRTKYIRNYLEESYIVPQQQGYAISKDQLDDFSRNWVSSLADIANQGGLPGTDVSAEQINTMNAKLAGATVYTDGEGKHNVVLKDKDGTSLDIPISQEIYDSFEGRFEASPAVKAFNETYLPSMLSTPRPIKYEFQNDLYSKYINNLKNQGVDINSLSSEQIESLQKQFTIPVKSKANYYSTSTDGNYQTTKENAGLSGKQHFPNVQYYTISGNVVSDEDPSGNTGLGIQLNIFNPVTGEWIENIDYPVPYVDKTRVVPTLQQISDKAIWQILNNTMKEPSNSEMKKLEAASKRPN